MGLRGYVKKKVKAGVKRIASEIPGYGEVNVVNGKPKTNRSGNAVRRATGMKRGGKKRL